MSHSAEGTDPLRQPLAATAVEVRAAACLNCGAVLHGPFCSRCGQRDVPPYPTIHELTHDAWRELSHWDGRYVQTFLTLLRRPGALTLASLEGRRRRYISPLRVYLTASVFYFLIAAATPYVGAARVAEIPSKQGNVTIDLRDPRAAERLTPEQRAQAERALAKAPWWAGRLLRGVLQDPAGLRRRFLEALPRVLFALVPVFAVIISLFYRRRPFPQHLIFAFHLHATIFIVMALAEASNFLHSPILAGLAGTAAFLFVVGYSLAAFRRVYRDPWWRIVLKSAGVSILYGAAGVIGMAVAIAWALR